MPERDGTNRIFRVRFLLEATADISLHAYHGPTLYGLLANAYGRAAGVEAVFPDGVLIDAPERCRVMVRRGEPYAFGLTILAPDAADARSLLGALCRGLKSIGTASRPKLSGLGGNFSLERVEDLVAGCTLEPDGLPQPIGLEHIQSEIDKLEGVREMTLHFTSPLRASRPADACEEGHAFLDGDTFLLDVFLRRLGKRLQRCAVPVDTPADVDLSSAARLKRNDLIWLDVSYGPEHRRKSLGGAVGRVRIEITDKVVLPWLVWGQYVHVGESTRFGFGAYRIEELGPHPFECKRTRSFLDLAYGPVAEQADHPTPEGQHDEFQAATAAMRTGDYRPHPHSRIQIPRDDGGFRELTIPSARDKALQRRLLRELTPGLDCLFESSSFAYRRGFGRLRAARALRDAFRGGFRYALSADFARYFDTIDHQELRKRLDAYLNDPPTVDLIMLWVREGAPHPDRGIPTGAPLSPLLANLFLDQFDECMAHAGGLLVRYSDDFLVLFHTESEADAFRDVAERNAQKLLLTLNEGKSATLDLNEPFDFLGYRFHKTGRWQADAHGHVTRVEDLGWYDASPRQHPGKIALPGEQGLIQETASPLVIFGPTRGRLLCRRGQLVCDYRDGQPATTIPVEQVREVLLLGPISLTHGAARACAHRDIPILLADEHGEIFSCVTSTEPEDDPVLMSAQIEAARDGKRRLGLSRQLLMAKVRNFASLAQACPCQGADTDDTPPRLQAFAERMTEAASVEELLGLEGAAAALWYARLPLRLPKRFPFRKRVAPRAQDPVNVLLNIAYTALYRQATMALQLVGLAPVLGILHQPRCGHLALASDIMEPFRHLMERVVLEMVDELKAGHFRREPTGRYPLRFAPDAARRFNARLYEALEQPVIARGQTSARTYRLQIIAQARSLRRHLLDPAVAFVAFEHYPP